MSVAETKQVLIRPEFLDANSNPTFKNLSLATVHYMRTTHSSQMYHSAGMGYLQSVGENVLWNKILSRGILRFGGMVQAYTAKRQRL